MTGQWIPEMWSEVPAKDFCASVRDGTHDSPRAVESGRYLITSRHIVGGRVDLSNAYLISDVDFEAINKRSKVDRWDVLISMIGTVGEPCLVRDGPEFAIKNIGLFKTKSELDGRWLYHYLTSPQAQSLIRQHSRGTTQLYVPLGALRDFPIRVPRDREVMRAITGVLGRLDDKIEANRRINQSLEAMAQAIFKSWFVDFDPVKAKIAAKAEGRDPLRAAMTAISGKPDAELANLYPEQLATLAATAALFPEEMENSELGDMPKGWHASNLGEQCAYLNRGISPKYIDEGGVLVLNQKCIRDFSLDPSKGRRHDPNQRNVSGRELQLGDVLVNSTGVGTLGRVAQVLRLDEPTIVDSHVTVVRTGANLNGAYLGQWFVTKQPDIEAMGEGSTGQTELSRGKLASMPVLVPGVAVLGAFSAAVSPLQSLISTRARESLVLQETRDALLPRLLSGELSPFVALQGGRRE